jgi:5-methylcytosine-specific restriction endonuclease McrA
MSASFYQSTTWKVLRRKIIDRDLGFDLGVFGVYIDGHIIVHHINPIDESDIVYQTKKLLDPDNLITVSGNTHNLIHYNRQEKEEWVERKPGDTKLW